MKILFYNDYNERIGGAERFFNDAVLQLLSQPEVSIKSCVFDTKEDPATNTNSLLTRATYFIQKVNLNTAVIKWFEAKIALFRPDIVHINTNNRFSNSINHVLLNTTIPVVYSIHDYYTYNRFSSFYFLERYLACTFITTSEDIYQKMIQEGKRIYLLNNMLNLRRWTFKSFDFENRGLTDLLFVGRLEESKGALLLIDMMQILVKTVPTIRLVIIGTGSLSGALAKRIQEYQLSANISLLGYKTDDCMQTYYHSAKLLIFPSIHNEALGYVGLEAQASGLPILAFDVEGVRTWCCNEKTGFLVAEKTGTALAKKVVSLLNDEAALCSVSTNAYNMLNQKFQTDSNSSLLTIYKNTLQCSIKS